VRNFLSTVTIGIVSLSLASCGATAVNVLSTKPEAWVFQFSSAVPPHPLPMDGASWYFDFPDQHGSVHYLTTSYTKAGAQTISMTFHIEIQGPVTFNGNLSADNICVAPARVRLYFQKANDDFSTDGNRWWSNPESFELDTANGSDVTLSVPITPDKWSTVYGEFGNQDEKTQAWFASAVAHIAHVGMTFGGGCFFGHGVNVSGGSARFILTDFQIS
jgi:hypothetical protein